MKVHKLLKEFMRVHKHIRLFQWIGWSRSQNHSDSWNICILFRSLKVSIQHNCMDKGNQHIFQCPFVFHRRMKVHGFETTCEELEELFLKQSRSEETSPYKVIKQFKTNDLICFLLIYLAYHTKSGGSGEEKESEKEKKPFFGVVCCNTSFEYGDAHIFHFASWQTD